MSMTGYVCFDNSCVEVELAMTQEERAKGLMNRANLPEYGGMLFIFDKEYIHKFWMKKCCNVYNKGDYMKVDKFRNTFMRDK